MSGDVVVLDLGKRIFRNRACSAAAPIRYPELARLSAPNGGISPPPREVPRSRRPGLPDEAPLWNGGHGEAEARVSHISQAYPDRVEVRGRDLTADLMGRLSFTEYFHLLLTGREPTDDQRFFLDLLLVAIAEHGMMPTNVAARMTLAADPSSLQGAVAAGILGAGPVLLGTTEECARLLARTRESGEDPRDVATRIRQEGGRLPGFGHPVHKPLDPRAERILELAHERGVVGEHVALAEAFRPAVHEAWGKPLTMNISMPMAAVLLDLGFPATIVKAVPILARTASLLGHLAEEQQESIGFQMAKAAEDVVEYEQDARA